VTTRYARLHDTASLQPETQTLHRPGPPGPPGRCADRRGWHSHGASGGRDGQTIVL